MPSNASHSLVVFRMGEQAFALGVAAVERVVRAVEIAPRAEAPHGACGSVKVQGREVPVFDLTARPALAVRASDHLILARTPQRAVALLVANVESVGPLADGGARVIHDLEKFLASADRAAFATGP